MADVLIFDDDPQIGDFVCELLRDKGLSVSHFLSGAGVLQLVQENKPRLVVLDLMMPGVDGLTACRTLKSNPSTRSVKVLILTGKEYQEDREAALRCGADLFLTKPFDALELQFLINRLLGIRAVEPAPQPPAPPVVVTVMPGGVAVQTAGLWILFDAGAGLATFMQRQTAAPALAWLLLTRYQRPAFLELAAAQPLLAAGTRLNLAGPDDADASLQKLAPYVCATLASGARAMPLLYPQREGEFSLAPSVRAATLYTQHPGVCLGYRVELNGFSIVYCPSHEIAPDLAKRSKHELEKFRRFFQGAHLLLHGFRRSLAEPPREDGLGRGAWEPVVDLAADAGARVLMLLPQAGLTAVDGLQAKVDARLEGKPAPPRCQVSRLNERLVL